MAVIIMIRQYQYSINYDFGFEQDNVLDVELQTINPHIFEHEYGTIPSVKKVSLSSHLLGIGSAPEQYVTIPGKVDSIKASSISINEGFISNMELELVAGKDFGLSSIENSSEIIVNEEFVKRWNLKDPYAAINKAFILPNGREVRIAGVVKDFHYSGLNTLIGSFFFEYDPAKFKFANLKLQPGDLSGTFVAMTRLWKKIGGEGNFTSQLFSDQIKDAYSFYITIMKLWGFLGFLAITVACLDLLGSVSFTTKKRFKEISIRKVMGASSKNLVLLLSKDFLLLMVIATFITIPSVYFLFEYLLTSIQPYSIQIGIIEIGLGLIITMVLGLSTILSQTMKAANANPVDNLRNE